MPSLVHFLGASWDEDLQALVTPIIPCRAVFSWSVRVLSPAGNYFSFLIRRLFIVKHWIKNQLQFWGSFSEGHRTDCFVISHVFNNAEKCNTFSWIGFKMETDRLAGKSKVGRRLKICQNCLKQRLRQRRGEVGIGWRNINGAETRQKEGEQGRMDNSRKGCWVNTKN